VILIGQSVPPTPLGMAFGRLKLWAQDEQSPELQFLVRT
jgi:hypothetical protein